MATSVFGYYQGKTWLFHVERDGTLLRYTAKEMNEWRQGQQEAIEKIAADIYSKAFADV